jgi:hypothetical protein
LGRDNEWETLINMQHYGVPTRLIDWTDNLGIALYFAVKSSVEDYPMSLYIMNPLELNKLSSKNGIPNLPNENMGLSYVTNYINREPYPSRYPIAVKCNWINERIWAQSGMFTVHGDERNDEEIISVVLDNKSAIYKIDIAVEAYNSLDEYFEISGLKDYKIFPDIQGIVKYINSTIKW